MIPSSLLFKLSIFPAAFAAVPSKASTFAGATSTAIFPPPDATLTNIASFFPDGTQVGFPGPTGTGDEAEALATAPAFAPIDSIFPLINPNASDATSSTFDVSQHWGSLSPLRSVKSFGLDDASPVIPNGCELKQVHLLHRHGARYPAFGSPAPGFGDTIHSAATSANGFSATGPLSFLNTWQFRLGAEILTPYGRSQLFNLGVGFRVKYGELLKDFKELPVFRTTSEARMIDSALHFAAGFFGVQSYQQDYHQLIIIEEDGFNNTLAPFFQCPNANNDIGAFGSIQSDKWAKIYLKPALQRLQSFVNGIKFEIDDLVAMQELCVYETISLGFSEFCDVFTEEEWKGFEYMLDLNFWYGSGPGNPATSAQGIGYVQELISRLTQTPLTSATSTFNVTLDNNNITFPLDQSIYVDVSHDTVIATILVAMNFTSLAANGPLPTDHIPKNQTYLSSQMVPFATNLVGQVLSCPSSSSPPTHIRWILNDAVLPLTGVVGCIPNKDGLCELDTYIKGMQQRIAEVDFEFDCFGNYTVPMPDTIIDGRFPEGLRK